MDRQADTLFLFRKLLGWPLFIALSPACAVETSQDEQAIPSEKSFETPSIEHDVGETIFRPEFFSDSIAVESLGLIADFVRGDDTKKVRCWALPGYLNGYRHVLRKITPTSKAEAWVNIANKSNGLRGVFESSRCPSADRVRRNKTVWRSREECRVPLVTKDRGIANVVWPMSMLGGVALPVWSVELVVPQWPAAALLVKDHGNALVDVRPLKLLYSSKFDTFFADEDLTCRVIFRN